MSNLNLNKVVLCGRLCAEPELKQTPSGVSVVTFTLAVNRRYQPKNDGQNGNNGPQADFISVTAWRQTAEFISRYFRKGSSLCVTGSIQTRTWQDAQGQKRYATEVVVDEAMFVDSKNEGTPGQSYTPDAYATPSFSTPVGADTPKFEELKSDDDLPF